MYASAVPVALSYYLLWTPPAGLSHQALFAYFVVVAILVRIFIAFYEIPSSSLAAELTDHYDQRTSILSYRYFFGWWGGLTMAVLAFAVFLQPDATHPVGVLNPDGYRRYGLAASVLMAVAILISALGTHSHIPQPAQAAAEALARPHRHPARGPRVALQPFVPRPVRRRVLLGDGGRAHRGAQRLLQHLLLGAHLEPDLAAHAGELPLRRGGAGHRAGAVDALRRQEAGRHPHRRRRVRTRAAGIVLRLLGLFPVEPLAGRCCRCCW